MTPDDDLDELLRHRFAGVRDADARRAPAFGEMVARARAAIPAEPVVPIEVRSPATRSPIAPIAPAAPQRRSPWRWVAAAAPLAVAAPLARGWLAPRPAAPREFDRQGSEWSRTERALNAPTDGLLAVPGSEYLRRLPALGSGAGATRRPS